jgi:glycosyltransferase involved in cell wall biosynthesis
VVSHRLHEDYAAFDIVHFLNLNNALETYLRLRRIRSHRRQPRVVLTPFHHKTAWMLPYYRRCLGIDLGLANDQGTARFDRVISAKDALRYGLLSMRRPVLLPRLPYLMVSTFRQKQYIVNHVDALLVHTDEEGESVRDDFRSDQTPWYVVPIGLGTTTPSHDLGRPDLPSGYILSVGRIEPLKNQLALIDAARALDVPLVLVGQENARHRDYLRRFRAALAGRRNVVHMPFTGQPGLDALYRHASLHVIASWFEVFPLTTVEAATNGCRVATTRNSYEAGVYGAAVRYLDPGDTESICTAIVDTLTDATIGRAESVVSRLQPWHNVLEGLLEAYRSIAS